MIHKLFAALFMFAMVLSIFSFSVAAKEALLITSTDPTNGATGVSINKTITITFSKDMSCGSNYSNVKLIYCSNNTTVPMQETIKGNTLALDPVDDLAYNVKYRLFIPRDAVRGANGSVLANDFMANFTTAPPMQTPVSEPVYQTALQWSGRTWYISQDDGWFTPRSDFIWVDSSGNLHVRIAQDENGKWRGVNMWADGAVGYGTYEWHLKSPMNDVMDANSTLGLFIYSGSNPKYHNELDIEFTRWTNPSLQEGTPVIVYYQVQPYTADPTTGTEPNTYRAVASGPDTVHTVEWHKTYVNMTSSGPKMQTRAWHYSDMRYLSKYVPTPDTHLWVFFGVSDGDHSTSTGKPIECVISSVSYARSST